MIPPDTTGGGAPRGRTDSSSDRDASRQLWAAADSGWVLMVELMAATFTWGGIGWLLDRWLGTAPWLLIAGFTVGWATGIYLAWVRHGREQGAAGGAQDGPAGGTDEEGGVHAGDAGS